MSYPGKSTGNGVPSQYSELVSVSASKQVVKGHLNKLRHRLPTQTQSQESSGTLIGSIIADRLYHGAVVAGPFQVGEVITGGTSGATGTVISINKSDLVYGITLGTFVVGEIITGGTSTATATLTAIDVASNFGQIVKIPEDNVSGLSLTVKSASSSLIIDDFEASVTTLQAAWVSAGVLATKDSTLFSSGTQGLRLDHSTNQNIYTHSFNILTYSLPSGNYVLNETITGSISGATAVISLVQADKLSIVSVVGIFANGEIITGSVSGVTSTVSLVANSIDLSNASSLDFDIYVSSKSQQQLQMVISDGVNTSVQIFTGIQAKFASESVSLQVLAGAGVPAPVDLSLISSISFQPITKSKNGYFITIDNLRVSSSPGNIGLRFYDLGPTLPVDGVTTLSSGTVKNLGDLSLHGGNQPLITWPLRGGKEVIFVDSFAHGVAKEYNTNTLLTPNNYYAITCEYIDSNIEVFGANPNLPTNFYPDGFAFSYGNIASPITALGPNHNCMFILKAGLNVWVKKVSVKFDDFAEGAHYIVAVENASQHLRIISDGILMEDSLDIDLSEAPILMQEGGKFEVYYSDIYTSKVSKFYANIEFWALKNNLY